MKNKLRDWALASMNRSGKKMNDALDNIPIIPAYFYCIWMVFITIPALIVAGFTVTRSGEND